MSLIRIRRERKSQGANERIGMRTRTLTILLIAVIGFLAGRPDFLDIGITYGLLNMVGTLAVLKFFRHGDLAYDHEEDDA